MHTRFRLLMLVSSLTLIAVVGFALAQTPDPQAPGAVPPAAASPVSPEQPQSPGAVILPGDLKTKSAPVDPTARFDADGDGKISLEESRADEKLYNRFKSMDTNKDGFISADEYTTSGFGPSPLPRAVKQETISTGTK